MSNSPLDKTSVEDTLNNASSILDRVSSWWSSDDEQQLTTSEASSFDEKRQIRVDLQNFSIDDWPDQRVEILEILWGSGNRLPGDDAFNLELFHHINLDSKSKILDIAGGLGNCSRLFAKKFYAQVDIVEAYPNLLPHLKKLNAQQKLEPFISILNGDLNNVQLPRIKYDLIYGREALFKIKDKQHALEKTVDALKAQGHLIFTDFVLEKDASSYRIFKNWSARENQTVYPVSIATYRKIIDGFEMEMKPIKDYSEQYIRYINQGWFQLKEYMKTHDFDDKFVDIMAQESDLWLSRVRALRSGKLKLVRFHVTF